MRRWRTRGDAQRAHAAPVRARRRRGVTHMLSRASAVGNQETRRWWAAMALGMARPSWAAHRMNLAAVRSKRLTRGAQAGELGAGLSGGPVRDKPAWIDVRCVDEEFGRRPQKAPTKTLVATPQTA